MTLYGIVAVFIAMAITVIGTILYNYYFHLWWRTKLVQAPIPFSVLFGMTFKRTSPRPVVEAYVEAVKGELDLPIGDLVAHQCNGGNVKRVVEDLIEARKEGGSLNFEQACAYDLSDGGVLEFTTAKHGHKVEKSESQ